jgi:hypothetical protein
VVTEENPRWKALQNIIGAFNNDKIKSDGNIQIIDFQAIF